VILGLSVLNFFLNALMEFIKYLLEQDKISETKF